EPPDTVLDTDTDTDTDVDGVGDPVAAGDLARFVIDALIDEREWTLEETVALLEQAGLRLLYAATPGRWQPDRALAAGAPAGGAAPPPTAGPPPAPPVAPHRRPRPRGPRTRIRAVRLPRRPPPRGPFVAPDAPHRPGVVRSPDPPPDRPCPARSCLSHWPG